MKVTTVTLHAVTDSEAPAEASEGVDMTTTSVPERSDPASADAGRPGSVESSTLTLGQVQVNISISGNHYVRFRSLQRTRVTVLGNRLRAINKKTRL